MSNQFIEKLQQAFAEGKRRFVALPLEKQWFGSLVGFVIGFIFFASVLRFDPQNLVHLVWLLKLALAYIGLLVLVLIAYEKWHGNTRDIQKLFPRVAMFLMYLVWWGVILAAVIYDILVLFFFKG